MPRRKAIDLTITNRYFYVKLRFHRALVANLPLDSASLYWAVRHSRARLNLPTDDESVRKDLEEIVQKLPPVKVVEEEGAEAEVTPRVFVRMPYKVSEKDVISVPSIHCRKIYGLLKEAGRILGLTPQRLDVLKHAVEVMPHDMYIFRDGKVIEKPDGVERYPGRFMTMQGPRSAFTDAEYIMPPAELRFVVKVLHEAIVNNLGSDPADVLMTLFKAGETVGIGGARALGEGRYKLETFIEIDEKTANKIVVALEAGDAKTADRLAEEHAKRPAEAA